MDALGVVVGDIVAKQASQMLLIEHNHVTQHDCKRIAKKLNTRPRKRLDYQTPKERFHAA